VKFDVEIIQNGAKFACLANYNLQKTVCKQWQTTVLQAPRGGVEFYFEICYK